jgi:hypothetical protein
MPAKRPRRSMADLLAEQREIEDPLAGDPRPGLAAVSELPQEPAPAPEPEQAPAPLPVLSAAAVPEPPRSPAGHGPLTPGELDHLAVCEAALDNLRTAFVAAGKALQVVRDGRLYRDGYATFEDYVAARWDLSRAQAYRLIDAWPLGVRLSPMGDKLNERQVRELLPLYATHGEDAAAVVYETVSEADGVQVTAGVLHNVVGILPADYFDRDEAVAQIRAYLAGDRTPPGRPPADPVQAFAAETAKLVSVLHRVAAGNAIKAARTADPDRVKQAVADIRAALDEIEREIDS